MKSEARVYWKYGLLVTAAVALTAQTDVPKPPSLRAEGMVRDLGNGQPIRNARVSLMEGRNSTVDGHAASGMAGRTGVDGTYAIPVPKAGVYSVAAAAAGYVLADAGFSQFVQIGGRAPATATANFDLVRSAAVSGRIVDAETDKPISGVEVALRRPRYDRGQLTLLFQLGVVPAITDADGVFRFDGLAPGDFILELNPGKAKENIKAVGAPQRPDGDVAERPPGYGRQWWPGGDRPDGTPPYALRAGADLSLSNIRLSTGPLYRVTGRLGPEGCGTDERFRVSTAAIYGTSVYGRADGQIPCRSWFLIDNLAPGEYHVTATGGAVGRNMTFYRKVMVLDRDLEITLPLLAPIEIRGNFELPDNFPADLRSKLSVTAEYQGNGSFGGQSRTATGDGSFVLKAPPEAAIDLRLTGMPALSPYYVSEMLYNGASVNDGFFDVDPRAMVQTLALRLSDKGAALRGRVLNKAEPAPGATVIAVPWPLRIKSGFPVHFTCTGGEDGRFALAALPPDSYHVIAVLTPAWKGELQKPSNLAAVAANGTTVELGPGSSREISLDLTWVSSGQ